MLHNICIISRTFTLLKLGSRIESYHIITDDNLASCIFSSHVIVILSFPYFF